jgi:hypothetical protein
MQKINLVTVVGHNTTLLPHMLKYYESMVDEIFVVVYRQSEDDGILEEVEKYGITPYMIVTEPKFNWQKVTELYNKVKQTKPNEWWVVSDDDEFHIYPKDIREMIQECEENGWEFITGGFLDRIGENGEFPIITKDSNIWKEFPNVGFFRNPLSGACPNKVCIMKGSVNVTSGQHYVDLGGDKNTWGYGSIFHPKRYRVGNVNSKNILQDGSGFIQVHHFKWDSTVLDRLKEVSSTKEDYTFWKEYKKMYRAIQLNDNKIDITNKDFYIQKVEDNVHSSYTHWDTITKKVVRI